MATPEQRQIVRSLREQGLDKDLPAIAVQATVLDGVDPASDDALLTPCVLLAPVPHPLTAAFLETHGATPIGRMSWTVGFGEDNYTDGPLRVLAENVRTGLVWPQQLVSTTKGPRDLCEYQQLYNKGTVLRNTFAGTPASGYMHAHFEYFTGRMPDDETRFGGFALAAKDRAMYIRAFTHRLEVPAHLPQVPLNLRSGNFDKPYLEPKPVMAAHAVAVLEWLAAEGVTVVDPDPAAPIATLRKRLAETVVAYPTPGRPAMAEVSVGRKVHALLPALEVPPAGDGVAATRGKARAEAVEAALRTAPVVTGVVHPGTRDVGRLALAEPFDDPRLRPYQQIAVGRHLATGYGLLNASSPGTGKTIMALSGMRERARTVRGYRGLVVVEANVRHQWGPEAAKWFPSARTVTIDTSKAADRLAQALAEAGDDPLLVITSYSLLGSVHKEVTARAEAAETTSTATGLTGVPEGLFTDALGQLALFALEEDTTLTATGGEATDVDDAEATPPSLGALLLDTFWHDLIADEAEVLRSTGTKQGGALWDLRRNAQVAMPLTGTPVNRNIDDLGRLVAWCRNDESLFHGVKLSTQFDLADAEGLAEYQEAMGAVVFRADTSEVSDEMPDIHATVMRLRPSAAEKALADAARMELKRVYDDLVEAIDRAEVLDPDNPAYTEARAALRAARGAHLGGTTLARMASSDPAALLGSTSAGAALLAGQGLIEAATRERGTKRAAVVADTLERVAAGEAVLIFTEFATVARGLIEDLDAAGARVGEVLGGGGRRRDKMIADFQSGDLDVLVATSSGERGLNLQRASTIVHYDLPWAPKGVLQRTGRALRLESKNQRVNLVFPLMEGTVEERVAATVVRRALEAMYALDKSRGVDISKTEIGLALGGLAASLGDTAEGRAHGSELLEITRLLVS